MTHRTLATERRHARSNDTLVSLCRLLEAARRDSSLAAVVLADSSGCLVAGSGVARVCEELAALSSLLPSSSPSNDARPSEIDLQGNKRAVRKLLIDGLEVSISALGNAQDADYLRISDGCRRILREPSSGRAAAH